MHTARPVHFADLACWKHSHALAIECHRLASKFPAYERHALAGQLRRSSSSVSANIAEGFGRGSARDYVRSLYIARGSLLETENHLLLARDVGHLPPEELALAIQLRTEAGRSLNGLIKSIRKHVRATRD